ncbi:helix-turn-helix domain-containing protein [Stappia sp. ES.058]|uniref:helix-turn-helix domain-containing protein n=1 Tax=Stappia sp. ES.058 TaxID=1881061 RepID=UPI00087DC828|nr:helix-turn-helix transcriptional regulator [Stappia sp. ES.058]SDT96779.1 Helix-turn-helix domain-containing protein [Stappia sp. ES.058]
MVAAMSGEAEALALIGKAFRRSRERAGLTVREAAQAAGTSGRVVSHAEHGKPVSSVSFLRLCRLHDVDPFALLDAIALHRREGGFHKVSRGVFHGERAVKHASGAP